MAMVLGKYVDKLENGRNNEVKALGCHRFIHKMITKFDIVLAYVRD